MNILLTYLIIIKIQVSLMIRNKYLILIQVEIIQHQLTTQTKVKFNIN